MRTKLFFIAVIAIMASFSSCTLIEQGEVGLKIFKTGDGKSGIEVVRPGWQGCWFTYYYKTFPQTLMQWSWTAGATEGSEENEEVVFQAEGEKLSADIGIEFEFPKEDEALIKMYQKYKRSPQEIIDLYLRKDVRSFFNQVTQSLPVEAVYASMKDSVRRQVQKLMYDKYISDGIIVSEITYLSEIRMTDKVKAAISAKIEAKQKAEMRENEVAETEAEARKKAAAADGEAQRLIKEAEGRARSMEIEGKALRDNPQVLELRKYAVQEEMAKSAKGWSTVVMSGGQASQLLNIGGGGK